MTRKDAFGRLKVQKGCEVLVKFAALLLIIPVAAALAQDNTAEPPAVPSTPATPGPLITLASEFLENNFVNFFAYGNGVYDSLSPVLSNGTRISGLGWEAGGGVNALHAFRDGEVSLSYRGDYRDYSNASWGSGTDQNLGLSYAKRLSRRWTASVGVNAGIFLYGETFYTQPGPNPVALNPFSPETRFGSVYAGASYRQTRRLSYSFSGGYSLLRYNYPGAYGFSSSSGSFSVNYRTTARTTLGGAYSYSHFGYQRNVGSGSGNSLGATLFHQFHSHWQLNVFGGATRSDASGFVVFPVSLIINNQPVTGYAVGEYHRIATFPSFTATVTHSLRRLQVSVSAGQSLSGGNGFYLASKNLYFNGVVSKPLARRASISVYANTSRLTSVANQVASSYASTSFGASYSVSLRRYFGADVTYSYIRYGTLSPYSATSDNHLAFGLTFSSKSIPLTFF